MRLCNLSLDLSACTKHVMHGGCLERGGRGGVSGDPGLIPRTPDPWAELLVLSSNATLVACNIRSIVGFRPLALMCVYVYAHVCVCVCACARVRVCVMPKYCKSSSNCELQHSNIPNVISEP